MFIAVYFTSVFSEEFPVFLHYFTSMKMPDISLSSDDVSIFGLLVVKKVLCVSGCL